MQHINKVLFASGLLLFTIVTFAPCDSLAASFQSLEQSAARLGAGDAGTTTNTNDAAIEFYNPAGMPLIKHPALSVSAIAILAHISMYDVKATNYNGQPVIGSHTGPETRDLIPALHLVVPATKRLAFGFGINVPYGLDTIYKDNPVTRYFATKSNIETINFALSAGYLLTKHLALGIGLDTQYMDAELNQAFDAASFFGSKTLFPKDLTIKNRGHDWGFGSNFGLMYIFSSKTRIGLAYRSEVKHNLKGHSSVYGIQNAFARALLETIGLVDCKVKSAITLPSYFTFSMQHAVNKRWTLFSDIQYTLWSSLKNLTLTFYGQPKNVPPAPPATMKLNYHNAWRFAVGQSYKINNKLTLRNGFVFDGTPTDEVYKTARIPGANRYWATVGLNYRFNPKLNFDLGYAFILFEHSHINLAQQSIPGIETLKAHYRAYAQLIGAQLNYQMGNVL